MRVEHRVRQGTATSARTARRIVGVTGARPPDRRSGRRLTRRPSANTPTIVGEIASCRFVERDADRAVSAVSEVHSRRQRARRPDGLVRRPGLRLEACRKSASFACRMPDFVEHRARARSLIVDAPRDGGQALRARGTRRTTPAMFASSACAVQMFDVAFSRRMCCSRVCSAIRYAVLPCASTDTPMIRPGAWRTWTVRAWRRTPRAARRSPSGRRSAGRCRRRRRRPSRPGGVKIVSASRSVATATRTPASCARPMNARRSCTRPASSGVCTSAPNIPGVN